MSTSLFLQIVEHLDGTITRPTVPLSTPQSAAAAATSSPVLSKDLPLNPTHRTWLRLYLPNPPPPPPGKLPVVLYFHGGGFVVFSPDFVPYHHFAQSLAAAVPALVVSLRYRLAPDHRLPAAYDDALDALRWLRSAADPWLVDHGDLARCFLVGSSSGGNMVYHAGLRALLSDLGPKPERPLSIAGLVMIQPYFGGAERTESELASEEDPVLPLRANEMMWRLALPSGADRDHEYCNPVAKKPPPSGVRMLPRCLVKCCKGDPLIDRQRAFVAMLEGAGVSVVARVDEDGYHAIELFDEAKAAMLFDEVREFVEGCTEGV